MMRNVTNSYAFAKLATIKQLNITRPAFKVDWQALFLCLLILVVL